MIMGQYQQWLHYREVDHQLQARLKELTSKLEQLQAEQAGLMAPTASLASNVIIQALTKQRRNDQFQQEGIDFVEVNDVVEVPDTPFEFSPINGTLAEEYGFAQTTHDVGGTAQEHNEAVSPFISTALFAWGNLPNFDSGELPIPGLNMVPPIPSTPHPDIDLLPKDMNTLMNRYSEANPQLKLPRLQQEATVSAADEHSHSPVDQQSMRTDRLVQRWLARWGRETDSQSEQGGLYHEQHKPDE
jgi:hypothetical protein